MSYNKLKVLVTGGGSPGIAGTLFSLKNNSDKRQIETILTDAAPEVIGSYLGDKFYCIPKASDKDNYLTSLMAICNNEKIDVILPQNTSELPILAENKKMFEDIGTSVIISKPEAIDLSNNKLKIMEISRKTGVPVARFRSVRSWMDLMESAKEFGWPENKLVVKPPVSNGSRGVRIIDEKIDQKNMFYNQKPTNLYTKMDHLKDILGDTFPELIITEFLPGDEYTVDVFRFGPYFDSMPRRRDLIRSGITFNGTVIKDEKISHYSQVLADETGLEFCFGFQFKMDEGNIPKIIECNPRVQGTMVLATLAGANFIYNSVKVALGESVQPSQINWNTKFFRYWGGIGINNSTIIDHI